MKRNPRRVRAGSMLVLCAALVLIAKDSAASHVSEGLNAFVQQSSFPLAPDDRSSIYFVDKPGALAPLSFEAGTTPLDPNKLAKSNRLSYVEIKGARASISLAEKDARFYLFVPDTPNVHPPFLVRLTTAKRGVRRAVVTTESGQRGFAYESGQIVKPLYTVLKRDGGMYFMEVRGRAPLMPGEYAFIGADLARLATFRVEAASN